MSQKTLSISPSARHSWPTHVGATFRAPAFACLSVSPHRKSEPEKLARRVHYPDAYSFSWTTVEALSWPWSSVILIRL